MDDEGNEMVMMLKSISTDCVRHILYVYYISMDVRRVCYTELRLNISYIDLTEMIGRVYDEKNDSTLEYTQPLSYSLSPSFSTMMVNVEHCTIYPYQDASDR